MPSYFAALVLLLLAWGAFAFGAVYPWAYTPLFWAAAAIGLLGCFAPGSTSKPRVPWAMVTAAAVLAAAVGLQLVPLTPAQLSAISPGAAAFLAKYDVGYVLASSAPGYRHPLSIDPAATRLGLAALVSLALLLIGTIRGLGAGSLRVLAAGLVALGAALALTGIVQWGFELGEVQKTGLVYGFWKPIYGTSPFGPFVNRNHFAGWMLLALPVAMGYFSALVARGMRGAGPTLRERALWFSSPEASRVILVGLAILVMGVSLVLTLSRSGIAGFLLAIAISSFVVFRRHARGSRRVVNLAYLALVALLAVGWVGVDAIVSRFAQVEGSGFGGRIPIWSDTVNVIRDFRWTGTGLDTYGTSMVLYQRHGLETHNVEAHDDYLQLAAEGGALLVVPAAALLVVLALQIRRRFRERADDPMGYWLRVGATTGLVAIGLQETVEFSLQMPGIAALFVVVAAIAARRAG